MLKLKISLPPDSIIVSLLKTVIKPILISGKSSGPEQESPEDRKPISSAQRSPTAARNGPAIPPACCSEADTASLPTPPNRRNSRFSCSDSADAAAPRFLQTTELLATETPPGRIRLHLASRMKFYCPTCGVKNNTIFVSGHNVFDEMSEWENEKVITLIC